MEVGVGTSSWFVCVLCLCVTSSSCVQSRRLSVLPSPPYLLLHQDLRMSEVLLACYRTEVLKKLDLALLKIRSYKEAGILKFFAHQVIHFFENALMLLYLTASYHYVQLHHCPGPRASCQCCSPFAANGRIYTRKRHI